MGVVVVVVVEVVNEHLYIRCCCTVVLPVAVADGDVGDDGVVDTVGGLGMVAVDGGMREGTVVDDDDVSEDLMLPHPPHHRRMDRTRDS